MMDWRRNHISLTIFFLFCIFVYAAIYTSNNNPHSTSSEVRSSLGGDNKYFQNCDENKNRKITKTIKPSIGGARRLLGGPGSSPPRCASKCGICTPCQPVHVSVPPGMRVTTEYYPEAWRCKCGNRLYMP